MLTLPHVPAELLGLVQELHMQQPRRTAPVLGPDGAPQAYAKRRFAADFRDNPAGDFLVSLDLQDGGGAAPLAPAGSGSGASAGEQPPASPPLLELALGLLLHTAAASGSTAALLYRRGLFSLCQELCSYCSPAVVAVAQRLYAAVANRSAMGWICLSPNILGIQLEVYSSWSCHSMASTRDQLLHHLIRLPLATAKCRRVPSAAEELLGSGATVPPLAGLLLHTTSPERQQAALGRLAAEADACSGDDFALLTGSAVGIEGGKESAVFKAWQLAKGQAGTAAAGGVGSSSNPGLQEAACRFLLCCCARAQRQQQLGPTAAPRGGAWGAIGRQALQQLLLQEQQKQHQAARSKSQATEDAFVSLKQGFLAPPAAAAAASQAAPASHGSKPPVAEVSDSGSQGAAHATAHTYKSGAVVIEELAPGKSDACTGQAAPAPAPAAAPVPVAAPAPASATAQATAPAGQQQSEEQEEQREEVADLRDVFDSSSGVAAAQRQPRAAWMAVPLSKKVRWAGVAEQEPHLLHPMSSAFCACAEHSEEDSNQCLHCRRWAQTSADVSVHVMLPPGTRAADVQVGAWCPTQPTSRRHTQHCLCQCCRPHRPAPVYSAAHATIRTARVQVNVTGERLAVGLKWYGRVVDGPLHRRVKAGETHWCLEDSEVS
jgi:hypothetical protein